MQHLFSKDPGCDSYPIEAVIGNLGEMILKKDNPVATGRMFDHIAWQLTNLYELQHPYADKVRQILEKYWYNPDDRTSLTNIPILRNELYEVAESIRQEIRNIIGDTQKEESTPLRIYRHIDEEHPAAA